MCTKEDRDKRIREMMSRKSEHIVEKMNKALQKIDLTLSLIPHVSSNSYEITDPNLCPQITKGEEYIKNLSLEILNEIQYYTGSGYGSINKILRHGNKGETYSKNQLIHMISSIDTAFRNAPPLEVAMTVYRGVRNIKDLRDDCGFSSCSLNKSVSCSFGNNNVFTITIPAGSRILFVKPISLVPAEDEVILDRGGMFRNLVPGKLIYTSQLTYDD